MIRSFQAVMLSSASAMKRPATFTDTSSAILGFVPEVTYGTTPATPTFQTLRVLSDTLSPQFDTIISNEIRPDAIVSEVRRSGLSAQGDIGFELHRNANLEDLFAAALRGAWVTDVLKGGLLKPAFTFERKVEAGATDYYLRFPGARVGGLSLEFTPEEMIRGSFRIMANQATATAAPLAGATYPAVAGANGSPMAGVDVSSIGIEDAAGVDLLNFSFELDNNMRMQKKIGSATARGIGYGRRVITGSAQVYFEDLSAYDLLLNDTVTALNATASDGTNSFAFVVPRVRFTGGEVPNPGNDQDFILTLNWTATYDPTSTTDLQITRA